MRPVLFFLTTELQRLTDWIRQSTQNWGYGINLSGITPTQVAMAIAVVIVVVVAIVVDLSTRERRAHKVRAPLSNVEYARALKGDPGFPQVEALPGERPARLEALHIRPLAPGDRARFVESWARVQARFVDGPGSAVADADQLLGDVLSTRGYPVTNFEERAADIAVDHPRVIEIYRAAHQGALRRTDGPTSTEDLRQVMIHYRTLFEELVGESVPALP
jgi:hypothetical protein